MEMTQQDKVKLIRYLDFICDYEASKPIEEMNEELIKSCVNVLLDLQDKHVEHSAEYINKQVRKIFHPEEREVTAPETVKTPKKVVSKKKIWLVAACIAVLVALFSIVSIAFEWNVFSFLNEKFGSVHSAPIDETIDLEGISVIVSGETRFYETIDIAFKNEKITALYPQKFNSDIKVVEIVRYQHNKKDCLSYVFNQTDTTCIITLNTQLNENTKQLSNEIIEVNNFVCYFVDIKDTSTVQVYFEYKNNTYQFNGNNKQTLINLINSLEEFSYEN